MQEIPLEIQKYKTFSGGGYVGGKMKLAVNDLNGSRGPRIHRTIISLIYDYFLL